MKKLMIAVCAVAFAVSVQAASILWGGAVSEPDGATEVAANTMAYLVYSDASFVGTGATFDGTKLTKGSDTLATMVSSHSISASEATNWEFGGLYDNTGKDVNGFYAILVSDNGANPKYSFYDVGEVTGTTATSPTTNLQVSWDAGYLTQGGYTVTGAVPEPTSGLLILLGMAGLALKRKRA